MLTALIIISGLIVLGSIIAGIAQAENDNFAALHTIALVIVLVITITFVVLVNESERTINSNVLVSPSIKIETIKNDSSIVKSDTTYIYSFKNNN